MARSRARYRFANEAPNWRYWDLIFDLEPAVERYLEIADFDLNWESGLNCGTFGTMNRQYEEVRNELLEPLMELAPERRRELVRQEPFHNAVLAELLLIESEMSEAGPESREEMARTVEWIADELPPDSGIHEIRARALTVQAVARHRLGDSEGADRLFSAALSHLAECPGGPAMWASFFETLADVREEQLRLAEAAACLWRSVELYRRNEWCGAVADRCLGRLGILYLRQNDPAHAMAALAQIELDEEPPGERARLLLGMATCMAAVDLREPARLLLRESRAARRFIVRHDHRLPLEWWDARISLHIGDLKDAIPRLDAVRLACLQGRSWTWICRSSVELVLAYARTGTRRTKRRPDIFGDLLDKLEAMEQLVDDGLDLGEGERAELVAALRTAGDLLRQHGLPEAGSCDEVLDRVLSDSATR